MPVTVREVGLRDGLQSITAVLPTELKLQWLQAAYASGLREIEVGSFVPPHRLPQLTDTAELATAALALPGLVTSVLVPNLKGAQRALDSGVNLMLLPLSASQAHSLANLHKTPDEVVTEIGRIRALRDIAGSRLACGHFHDTRGLGMANVFAAWQTGLRRFDACLGGIGGCPHAPGASGNVATEDMTYLFASMGVPTGLDFAALLSLRSKLAQWLDPAPLHGTLWRAGLPRSMME